MWLRQSYQSILTESLAGCISLHSDLEVPLSSPEEACLSPVALLKENICLLTGVCVGTHELLQSEKKKKVQNLVSHVQESAFKGSED